VGLQTGAVCLQCWRMPWSLPVKPAALRHRCNLQPYISQVTVQSRQCYQFSRNNHISQQASEQLWAGPLLT